MQGQMVYAAINAVAASLAKSGIAKTRENKQQGYKFRGIDETYGALSPLLAEHKLAILPNMLEREVQVRETKSGGAMYCVTVKASFDLVSAEDGSKHTVVTYGEAMDTADKATNKAMSAAFKYMAMMSFCIPLEGVEDADESHPEETLAKAVGSSRDRDTVERRAQPVPDAAFKERLEVAAKRGLADYEAAWKEGTKEQRVSCASLHEGLKAFASMVTNRTVAP